MVLRSLAIPMVTLAAVACDGASTVGPVGGAGPGGSGGTGGGAGATGGGGEVSVELDAQTIAELGDGAYLLALDSTRLGVIEPREEGDALCPDCVTLPPDQCPASCERHHLDLHVRDHDGTPLSATERLLTWFPAAFDHYAGVPARVALASGFFGLVWLECDGSPCSPGIAGQSCTGRYQRFDDTGAPSGSAVTLFEGWWGDVELAYNATEDQLLVLHAPPQAGSFGSARVTLIDPAGTTLLPWTAVGSNLRFSAGAAAHESGFVVVIADGDPGGATSGPCAASCDCLTLTPPVTPDAAVLAFVVDASGVGQAQVIASQTVVASPRLVAQGDELVLSGLRGEYAAVFASSAADWVERGTLAAPSNLWFDARVLPNGTALWFGSDQPDAEDALLQRLVAGATTAAAQSRLTVGEPERVFVFEPTRTGIGLEDGSVRVFAVRGRWTASEPPDWERFEILRIDARAAH